VNNGLPDYTPDDPHGLQSIIDSASAGSLDLPITFYPINRRRDELPQDELCQGIVRSFFSAVTSKKDEAVAMMIQSNLVTANTTSQWGETPLLAAVRVGNVRMCQELLDFEADVNTFGRTPAPGDADLWSAENEYVASRAADKAVQRTPLMLAAAMGNINLVKLFIEVYHADDALVAPDGELALRLASDNGHRDIVQYLPSRRGGGWRRWKKKHEKAMSRAKRAFKKIYYFFKILLYEIPKFFVWSCPKHLIVLPIERSMDYCWKHRKAFGGWVKRQAKEMPGRLARGAAKVWRGIKKIPETLWKILKYIPRIVKAIGKWIWGIIIGIPKALKVAGLWLWDGVKRIAHGVGSILGHLASFLHTAFSAIMSFFRNITLKDVWNGFCSFLRAIFVSLLVKLWSWIWQFGETSYTVMKAVFGELGELIWWIGCGIIYLVIYVPTKLGVVLASCGESIRKAWIELLVWIDPKR
jgi:hypothetical protein